MTTETVSDRYDVIIVSPSWAVEPESEEQRAAIREIMEAAAPRFAETFQRTQEEMRRLSDSVMTELEAVLTPAQLEDLREHMLMRRGRPPSEGRRREEGLPAQ